MLGSEKVAGRLYPPNLEVELKFVTSAPARLTTCEIEVSDRKDGRALTPNLVVRPLTPQCTPSIYNRQLRQ